MSPTTYIVIFTFNINNNINNKVSNKKISDVIETSNHNLCDNFNLNLNEYRESSYDFLEKYNNFNNLILNLNPNDDLNTIDKFSKEDFIKTSKKRRRENKKKDNVLPSKADFEDLLDVNRSKTNSKNHNKNNKTNKINNNNKQIINPETGSINLESSHDNTNNDSNNTNIDLSIMPAIKKKKWYGPRCDEAFKGIKSTAFKLLRQEIYNIERKKRISIDMGVIQTIFAEFRSNFITNVKKKDNLNNLDRTLKEIIIDCFPNEHSKFLNHGNFNQIFSDESSEILNKTYSKFISEFTENKVVIDNYLNRLKSLKLKKNKSEELVNDYETIFRSILRNFKEYLSAKKIDYDFYQ